MPRDLDVAGSIRPTGWPPTAIAPESGVSAPVMILTSVDLPAPFSPTSAWTSPGARSKDTRRSAWIPVNDLEMEVVSRSGGDMRVLPDETQTKLHRAPVVGGRNRAHRR